MKNPKKSETCNILPLTCLMFNSSIHLVVEEDDGVVDALGNGISRGSLGSKIDQVPSEKKNPKKSETSNIFPMSCLAFDSSIYKEEDGGVVDALDNGISKGSLGSKIDQKF